MEKLEATLGAVGHGFVMMGQGLLIFWGLILLGFVIALPLSIVIAKVIHGRRARLVTERGALLLAAANAEITLPEEVEDELVLEQFATIMANEGCVEAQRYLDGEVALVELFDES